ncbi:MAG: hypothetical protein AB8G95_01050 [Anaerolineae bacterium]
MCACWPSFKDGHRPLNRPMLIPQLNLANRLHSGSTGVPAAVSSALDY